MGRPDTTEHPHDPPAPVPAARSSGSRPATSRTPPAPLRGRAPPGSWPTRPLATDISSYRETGDASHARPKAATIT